jgi:hypothetical protein
MGQGKRFLIRYMFEDFHLKRQLMINSKFARWLTYGIAVPMLAGCSAQSLPSGHFGTAAMQSSGSYDAKAGPLVYVSNVGANSIQVFRQSGHAQSPIATITNGIVYPCGLATDRDHNLYVTDAATYQGQWVVQRFAPGTTSPQETYTTDLAEPTGVVVAKDGTIYIANFNSAGSGWVSVYPKGDASNEYRLSDFSGGAPLSVALDSHQNLYVMYAISSQAAKVNEYAPKAKTGKNLDLNFSYGAGIQVDPHGNIVVVQQVLPSELLVFSPGKTEPSRSIAIPNGGEPYAIAFNQAAKLLFAGDSYTNVVDRFAFPAGKFQYPIAGGFDNPGGLATDPGEF